MTDDPDDAAGEELEALESDAAHEAEPLPEEFLSAAVLRPKPAFLEWVRSVRPPDEEIDGALAAVVVLAPELARQSQLSTWVEQHHEEIFARQLAVWTEDESRWPELSFEALRAWFDIDLAAGVDDLRQRPLLPDVTCEPVSLRLLVAVFVGLPPAGTLYIDVRSGAVVGLSENDIAAMHAPDPAAYGLAPADLEQMRRVYESDTLVDVLGTSDVDELELMGTFAESQDIQGHRNRLLDALNGKKPRRHFKNALEAAGLTERWEEWQASTVQAALRSALDSFRIPYVDDIEKT